MKRVGLPISHKENENRRALIPEDIARLRHPEQVYIERGYGQVLGYTDEDYTSQGVRVASHEEVIAMEVVCDPKIGDADYLTSLKGQVVFGWLHAVQNRDIADALIDGGLTAYAWEDMLIHRPHSSQRVYL